MGEAFNRSSTLTDVAENEDPFEFQKKLEKARQFSFSDSRNIERREDVDWIEPDENANVFDLEKVTGTVKVQGFELDEPPPPDPHAVEEALKRSDPIADHKRNRESFKVICPTCLGSGKCQGCRGRGRVKLIFKCKVCGGTGKCRDCDMDTGVNCSKCGEPVSRYADNCRRCGVQYSCPQCGRNLPAMATKCTGCHQEFICGFCDKPYPRHFSHRCPHCNAWNR